MKTVFGVLGGDKRQLYLARSILKDGFLCFISGLEKLPEASGLPVLSPSELTEKCDVIILPLPCTLDGKTLNAPYSKDIIVLDDEFVSGLENKLCYGGMVSRLIQSSDIWSRIALEEGGFCPPECHSNCRRCRGTGGGEFSRNALRR